MASRWQTPRRRRQTPAVREAARSAAQVAMSLFWSSTYSHTFPVFRLKFEVRKEKGAPGGTPFVSGSQIAR
jgi:hypothetical protein